MVQWTYRGLWLAIALALGCGGGDGGTDGDADTDSDSDTDTGSDADSDSDTGTGTGDERFTFTVEVTGPGTGRVQSDGGAIDCASDGGTCSADFDAGDEVVLTATADAGFVFHGWVDACRGGADCTVVLDDDRTAGAAFVPIAYHSTRARDGSDAPASDGSFSIWTVRTDGTSDTLLPNLDAASMDYVYPRWSPRADRIALLSRPVGTSTFHVEIANADGSDAVPVQDPDVAHAYDVDWSPDGDRIVFQSDGDPGGGDTPLSVYNVWTANADGTGLTALTTFESAATGYPHFSPDGTRIAYETDAPDDGSDVDGTSHNLWVMNADGTGAEPITHYTSGVWFYPRGSGGWSPDGEWIVCMSIAALDGSDAVNPGGAPNVWVVRADGSEAIPLTSYTDYDVFPDSASWSPDGARVLFESAGALDGTDVALPSGAYNLWVVASDGTGLDHLTQSTVAEHYSGRWSADGSVIVHEANLTLDGGLGVNDNGTFNIWISNGDGTDPLPLTTLRGDGVYSGAPSF